MIRPTKRSKLGLDDNKDETNNENNKEDEVLMEKVWDHYRNFLDSCCNEEDEGDIDELLEIITLCDKNSTTSIPYNKKSNNNDESLLLLGKGRRKDLFPIVLSMTHYHLANHFIPQTIDVETTNSEDEGKDAVEKRILKELQLSLEWYPYNCATWSVGTNYARMKQLVPLQSTLCRWFYNATIFASKLRRIALELLEEEDDDDCIIEKEWLELLVLNGMVGAEYITTNDDDDDDDDDCIEDDDINEEVENVKEIIKSGNHDEVGNNNNKENYGGEGGKIIGEEEKTVDNNTIDEEEEEEDGYFSSSSVEATSRFMGAMIQSTLGKHDVALGLLNKYDITHRLHPNVWQSQSQQQQIVVKDTTTNDDDAPTFVTDGVLPQELYEQMCNIFESNSDYWKESDYAHRGYHSYFMDIPSNIHTATTSGETNNNNNNIIEQVIVNHLLPLAQRMVDSTTKIIGAEWWPHTRPIGANLGHNLHFDTDESILEREGIVSHPIISSVLYLTGGGEGGSTIVLNQTPYSKEAAKNCWSCQPKNNSMLLFHGNQLHGVLPCPGRRGENGEHCFNNNKEENKEEEDGEKSKVLQLQWDIPSTTKQKQKEQKENHRTTFMVGFWTRSVPDKMKHPPKIYGPCGPLPPVETTKWVQQINTHATNNNKNKYNNGHNKDLLKQTKLRSISPVWESINNKKNRKEQSSDNGNEDDEVLLDIPRAIDHRFFVKNVPECFKQSLFEKDNNDYDSVLIEEEEEEEEDE